MKILLFLSVWLILILQSCEPPRDCTNPNCVTSSILVKVKANLSDTNKVLHVGDTLKMRLRIPDTLATNEGTYYLGSIQKAWLGLDYYRLDTIINKSTGTIERDTFAIKKGRFTSNSTKFVEVDISAKELELHFVANKKGKFYIQISPQSGRLEITEKDGTKYLIMLNTGFNVKDSHHDVFLSSIGDLSYRIETQANLTSSINSGFGWYVFKVE